jgi:hypothetical protein
MDRQIVRTTVEDFTAFTGIGYWTIEGDVKYHRGYDGIVNGEAKAKTRSFQYIPVTFIITDYFYSRDLVNQRLNRS